MRQLDLKQLKGEFDAYLKRIGRLEPITLGESEEQPIKREDNQYLIQLLDQHAKSNNYLVLVAIIILCLSFLASTLLLLSYRQNPEAIKLIAGGIMILTLGIIRWLHRFWIQRSFIAISLTILDKMQPEQAANVMTQLYWNFIRQSPNVWKK